MKEGNWLMGMVLILWMAAPSGVATASDSQNRSASEGGSAAVEVSAVRLQRETVTLDQTLPGRSVAYEIAEIRPQVSGIVTGRLFEEGSVVTQGQQLYQIDSARYQAAYDRALAELQKAEASVKPIEAKCRRFKDLVEVNAVSQQEYDEELAELEQAKANIAIAKAAVTQAKINLDYTKVYAPISGRIGQSRVTKGALVTANQLEPMAIIIVLDPIYVDMTQPSADLMELRQQMGGETGLPVRLELGERRDLYAHEGRLLFHEVNVDQTTGTVKLRALFPNPDRLLLPGLFVRTQLRIKYPGALLVPQRATQRQADASLTVWVVNDHNIANPVRIFVEREVDQWWLVDRGLEAGDLVVTEGQLKLKPGSLVRPTISYEGSADKNKAGE